MEKTYLVTMNMGKVESFQNILDDLKIDLHIEILKEDYPEDKEKGTTDWVALQGAKFCANEYNKTVLVNDTGLYIQALNGFPGVNTKFTLEKIGNAGLIKLLDGVQDRRTTWVFSLGFCEPGGEPQVFTAEVTGVIAGSERGDDGFGFDPIFVPDGHDKTFAEDTKTRDNISPFRETVVAFAEYFNEKK